MATRFLYSKKIRSYLADTFFGFFFSRVPCCSFFAICIQYIVATFSYNVDKFYLHFFDNVLPDLLASSSFLKYILFLSNIRDDPLHHLYV